MNLDLITLEVWWSRLVAIADQLDTPGYQSQPGLETRPRHRHRRRHPPARPPLAPEKERRMTMDRRTHRLVTEMLTVLERHGHHARDGEHTDQAIALIIDLARTYMAGSG